MKKYLLLGLMLAFSVVTAHAYAPKRKAKAAKQSTADAMKFGIQLGGISLVGGFFEYKITEQIGIQTGLSYLNNLYYLDGPESTNSDSDNQKVVWVKPDHIVLPIIVRIYPGDHRQFCLFTGVRTGYLIGGDKGDLDRTIEDLNDISKGIKIAKEVLEGKNKTKLTEVDQHRKFDFSIVAGFDYEFSFGLSLGLSYGKGMIDVIKAKDSVGNWTLRPAIGYNIAKLIQ
jgi:hypothetical protein